MARHAGRWFFRRSRGAPEGRPAGVDLAFAPSFGQIAESRASRGDGDPVRRRAAATAAPGQRERRPWAGGQEGEVVP